MIAVRLLAFALAVEFTSGPGFDPDSAPSSSPTAARSRASSTRAILPSTASSATAGRSRTCALARVADRLYFSGGNLMCEDPFELV